MSLHAIITYWECIHTSEGSWVFTIFFRVPETLTQCLIVLSTWVTKATTLKVGDVWSDQCNGYWYVQWKNYWARTKSPDPKRQRNKDGIGGTSNEDILKVMVESTNRFITLKYAFSGFFQIGSEKENTYSRHEDTFWQNFQW